MYYISNKIVLDSTIVFGCYINSKMCNWSKKISGRSKKMILLAKQNYLIKLIKYFINETKRFYLTNLFFFKLKCLALNFFSTLVMKINRTKYFFESDQNYQFFYWWNHIMQKQLKITKIYPLNMTIKNL